MSTTKKITELDAITSAANTDLLYIVHDPAGVPASNKITVQDLFKTVNAQAIDAKANTAYTNAVVVATNLSDTAYSNAAILATQSAAQAYSNAQIYANSVAAEAYANSKYKTVTYVTNTSYSATELDEIIIVDCGIIGSNSTVYLPNSAINGKVYTVKYLSDSDAESGRTKVLTVAVESDSNLIEDFGTTAWPQPSTNSMWIDVSGRCITWTYYDGSYFLTARAN